MYLDLHIFHMRDHKDRGGQETGNLRKQFENTEIFSFIFHTTYLIVKIILLRITTTSGSNNFKNGLF